MSYLYQFAKQSNEIERVYEPERHRIHEKALKEFLKQDSLTREGLEKFVSTIQPSACLRVAPYHQVSIGGRMAPSAKDAQQALTKLIEEVNKHQLESDPWKVHCDYEYIHPFMDGNGRSGRALWLWLMTRQRHFWPPFLFLQMFYYQTLANGKLNF